MATHHAIGKVLNVTLILIGSDQVDGMQKILNGDAVFDLKLGPHMLDGNLYVPHYIAVFF